MSAEVTSDSDLAIAHVLFTDIVGYSNLLINEQSDAVRTLSQVVCETEQFRRAEGAGKLVSVATGDGIALAFFTSPDSPVRCAIEIAQALKQYPELKLRMGINSGPVDTVSDVNQHANVAGGGINLAQRVMDCGDAGHILLSKRLADDLGQYGKWRAHLHDLGSIEVKHGVRVDVVNLCTDAVGNREVPARFRQRRVGLRRRRFGMAAATLLLVSASGLGAWYVYQRSSENIRVAAFGNDLGITIPAQSVAVLPFDNLSSDQENAFFADGIQDDLLTSLARIKDLKVISRSSVMSYRGAQAARDSTGTRRRSHSRGQCEASR